MRTARQGRLLLCQRPVGLSGQLGLGLPVEIGSDHCMLVHSCKKGLMCVDEICVSEPSAPEPQEIWLLGSLELTGVTIDSFDVSDFALEAKKALMQAAGGSRLALLDRASLTRLECLAKPIKSFTVTGVTTLISRRRADALKVDYRVVVDGASNGIAVSEELATKYGLVALAAPLHCLTMAACRRLCKRLYSRPYLHNCSPQTPLPRV